MSTYRLERPRLTRPADDRRPARREPTDETRGRRAASHEKPTDEVLVRRLRAGDTGAFETIFRRYEAPLLSYCRHMLGCRDEAEDTLQQTFIRAHRALVSASPPRDLRPWLYAIARNCAHTAISARRPTAELGDEPSYDGLAANVQARADLRELVADLQTLPEDQRSALLMAELGDLPHAQIAGVVDCQPRKVKALIHQARTTLIAQRDARATSCEEIRTQLSVARGSELRRGPLRRHLGVCPGCRDFAAAVGAQRSSLAVVLPVVPTAGLALRILGHTAAGAASTGAGGLSLAGGGHAVAAAATVAGGGSASAGTAAAGAASEISVAGASAGGAGGGLAATGASVSTAGALAAGGAGASGAGGVGAALGGGLAAKLAIGGTVAVIASAGVAATVHGRPHPARWMRTSAIGGHLSPASAAKGLANDLRVERARSASVGGKTPARHVVTAKPAAGTGIEKRRLKAAGLGANGTKAGRPKVATTATKRRTASGTAGPTGSARNGTRPVGAKRSGTKRRLVTKRTIRGAGRLHSAAGLAGTTGAAKTNFEPTGHARATRSPPTGVTPSTAVTRHRTRGTTIAAGPPPDPRPCPPRAATETSLRAQDRCPRRS